MVLLGERRDGDAELARFADHVVVDVGDVLDVAHLEGVELEVAPDGVEGDERARVAEVADVVRRDAAHVHAHNAGLDGVEGFDGARARVVDLKQPSPLVGRVEGNRDPNTSDGSSIARRRATLICRAHVRRSPVTEHDARAEQPGEALPDPMALVDHVTALRDARAQLLAALEGVDEAAAGRVVHGEWRVHDLLTHIAAWDELVAAFLRDLASGTRDFELTAVPTDDWSAWNAGQLPAHAADEIDARLERLNAAREALFEALWTLEGGVLAESVLAPWGTEDLVRGHLIAQALHDAQHADTIRDALGR